MTVDLSHWLLGRLFGWLFGRFFSRLFGRFVGRHLSCFGRLGWLFVVATTGD
jgi:hypothetical protein